METQKELSKNAKKIDVDRRFDQVDRRFDRIEKLILPNHKERIEKLEMDVKELKELIAFN
jgi:hypothetical protein